MKESILESFGNFNSALSSRIVDVDRDRDRRQRGELAASDLGDLSGGGGGDHVSPLGKRKDRFQCSGD
jgi:hypothetical protein